MPIVDRAVSVTVEDSFSLVAKQKMQQPHALVRPEEPLVPPVLVNQHVHVLAVRSEKRKPIILIWLATETEDGHFLVSAVLRDSVMENYLG